jgi:hypothetical protein
MSYFINFERMKLQHCGVFIEINFILTVFWDVTPCGLVDRYQSIVSAFSLPNQITPRTLHHPKRLQSLLYILLQTFRDKVGVTKQQTVRLSPVQVQDGLETYVCRILITYRNVGCPGIMPDTDETKAIYFNCIRLTV